MSQTAPFFQGPALRRTLKSHSTLRHRRAAARAKQISSPGDDAISRLFQDCHQRVYRMALRITRNDHDAEDAQQETMVKAFRHLDQFEGRARFTTWISRIAINESLMSLRKRNDLRRVPLDDVAENAEDTFALRQFRPPAENPEANFARRELRASINEAIGSLRPLYRDVFVLRAVDELSTSETARALKLTASTVKTRLRRARVELRYKLRNAWTRPASIPGFRTERCAECGD
ncbi:MAG: sigma-70 family RNA polymerase sigma factor [Candidatus Acidiferrales bacterium]